ncbi:prolyl oligopeptidase family serine peptidase [Photobacterium sp. TY1-4]|uniref:prolyl oligopeptidase family serine peptidase n=1 Tax=Photobacterium sp. TY1-4 TaxID=2899122 RepID=UPI0021BE4F6E|nr:prolyl oligopeptidase family serine peptidase [Photobacterium sp. TY1-4]UXI01688.1 prolyl oligopeptidase family serine peptidase [Photobacterium sp. TY1-4]
MRRSWVGIICCVLSALVAPAALAGNATNPNPADPSYQWLRDDTRQSAVVLNFLQQENQRTESQLAAQQPLEQTLLSEWQSRSRQSTAQPWRLQGEFNYRVDASGQQLIRQNAQTQAEAVVLDLSTRREGAAYYSLGNWQISPDHRWVALAEDRRGDRNYQISVIALDSGKAQPAVLPGVATDLVWSNDSQSLYVVGNEANTYRPHRVLRWMWSTDSTQELFREADLAWMVSIYPSTSGQYVLIQSNNHNSSEQHLVDRNTGRGPGMIRAREPGVEYYADVRHDTLYLSSNLDGDFALYQAVLTEPNQPWQAIWQTPPTQHLKNWLLYPQHIVLEVTRQQHSDLVVLNYQGKTLYQQTITPSGGVAWLSGNSSRYGQSVRIRRMSMAQPPQWLALDLETFEMSVLGEDRYQNIEPQLYRSEQIQVLHDGVSVPVSLVYRPDQLTAHSPVVLYGYGAYGTPMRPYFMSQVLSLLDRGMIYAIAHVRGGGYLGPAWYEQGKGMNKPNAFADYLAVAQTLKQYRGGKNRPLLAIGGSAGGTLVATALNQQPALFSAAVLQVPFVDVVATMSDPTLPLTRQEYAEWGDPSDPAQRAVMAAYSPVDNIARQAYPPMLVTAGLYDSQVPYWEPAKWVAKVRDLSVDTGPYLLQTDMQGGHRQDARQAQQQQAREYAFLLRQAASLRHTDTR